MKGPESSKWKRGNRRVDERLQRRKEERTIRGDHLEPEGIDKVEEEERR